MTFHGRLKSSPHDYVKTRWQLWSFSNRATDWMSCKQLAICFKYWYTSHIIYVTQPLKLYNLTPIIMLLICWVANSRPFFSKIAYISHILLYVTKPVQSFIAPVIMSKPDDSYGPLGANLTLDCEARGHPAPTITWRFVNTEGKTIALPSKFCYFSFTFFCKITLHIA